MRTDVRVVVRLRGYAATARHLAVARAVLERERRRMKEHAWKLNPLARADAYRRTSFHSRLIAQNSAHEVSSTRLLETL